MSKNTGRTVLLFAILSGSFVLLDFGIDILIRGAAGFDWSHLIFSVAVVSVAFLIIYRVSEIRKRAETMLRQARDELELKLHERSAEIERTNKMLNTLIETLPVGLTVTDSYGEVVLSNSLARSILDCPEADLASGSYYSPSLYRMDGSMYPADELPLIRALQRGETITGIEAQLVREDGSKVYVLEAASPVRDESGYVLNAVEVVQDITHLKRIEAKIEHLSSFPQLNPNPVLEVDLTGRIKFSNPATVSTLQRLNVAQDAHLFLPDDLAFILENIEQREGQVFYREVQVGDEIFGESIHYVAGVGAARIYAYNITERKHVEQDLQHALQASQQHQAEVSALLASSRAVLEQSSFETAARTIFDACKNMMGASAGYVAMLSEGNTQSRPIFLDSGGLTCLVDAALPMPVWGLREKAYSTNQVVYENDFSHSQWMKFLPKGHLGLENVLFAPLAVNKIVVGLLGLANKPGGFNENDAQLASAFAELAAVSLVNKRSLELLSLSEERYRSVVESSNDAIFTCNANAKIVFWNKTAERVFGYQAGEILGQAFTCLMPANLHQRHEEAIRRGLAGGQSSMVGKTIEAVGLRKEGSEFPIELSLTSWKTHSDFFFTCAVRDITERKRSEQAMQQMQANLARGIHEQAALEERQRLARELHDSVSQALYGISLGANTALTLFDIDQKKVLEALKFVLSQAQAGLMEMRALIFELRPESLEMEGLVAALNKQKMALHARHDIDIEMSLCAEPDMPLQHKETLYRIALEGLLNAIKHSQCNRLTLQLTCEPEGYRLEVDDNGIGFNPGASYPGHLGLRSIRERAEQAGGSFEIESAPGAGTRVRVLIPHRQAQIEEPAGP